MEPLIIAHMVAAAAHAATEKRWSLAGVHRLAFGGPARGDHGALAVGAFHVAAGAAAIAGYPQAMPWSLAIILPDFAAHSALVLRIPRHGGAEKHWLSSLVQVVVAANIFAATQTTATPLTWGGVPWWFGVAVIGGGLAASWWRGWRARS